MTISLVTGGAGFVGSHVVDHLIEMGHEVVVLDDLSGGTLDNLPAATKADWLHGDENPPCIFVEADMCDANYVDTIFRTYKPDYVFHLAAYAAEGLSHHIRRFNYETNVVGSANLINAAVNYGVKRFVFTSSAAVYGYGGGAIYESSAHPEPIDPYGIAKLAVEQDLKAAKEMFGLPYTIFRMHNVYGPRQNMNDGYRNVIGIFMRQCLQGHPMTIFGDGWQRRQFTYIDDVAPFVANCINVKNTFCRTFNIGNDEQYSIGQVAAFVQDALEVEAEIQYLPARTEVKMINLEHREFQAVFGLHRSVPLSEGVSRMAAWARTQQLREPRLFAEIEIDKNLPAAWRKLHVD